MRRLHFFIVAFILAVGGGRADAQSSCASNYTTACIGATVCYSATGTSKLTIPQNLQRRYLLIQAKTFIDTVDFAICNPSSAAPGCIAVLGTNTFSLQPPSPTQYPNYEVSALNSPATPPPRVPTGAIAVITGGTTDTVCILENNG